MDIQWFPGHMQKAQRMIREHLKLVDVAIELLDARVPISSANPLLNQILDAKPRVIVLNKADLADEQETRKWIRYFEAKGYPTVLVEAVTGKGTKALIQQVEQAASAKIKAMVAKGIRPRAVRAMIIGIPNVGKSSLINRLLGTATVRTGDKPGVTRGKQWLKIGKSLELLDTPGVLWPKFQDTDVAYKLAVSGAISDEVVDIEKVAVKLIGFLKIRYADRLVARYKLNLPLPEDDWEGLAEIGRKRGCLRAGGNLDMEKACRIILTDFRTGKLGKITLDTIPGENQ